MIANHKGEIPFFVLLLPFLAGIGLGLNLLAGANTTWLLWVFFILCLAFITFNLSYNQFNVYKSRWLGGAFINAILFLFGWIIVIQYNELNKADHFSKTSAHYLVVKINNEPIIKNGLVRFTADVEQSINKGKKLAASGTLLIAIKDSNANDIYYGDELLIPSKYNPVEPPLVPGEFNYKKYLANQNVYYQAFLYPKQYIRLNKNAGNPVIAKSLRLRQTLIGKLKLNMRDTNAIAVASTLILGYKADLSNDVLQAYSKTGTVHVLSVSGAHVAILYILLALGLGFLDRFRYGKLIKALIIITVIWYYSMLSGFSPAVCRAAVMISMVIIGKTFTRYINTLNILAVSAFVLLAYDPFFITDVGFQLSYFAVAGLIIFQPVVYKWFKFKNKWADKLWALCSVSVAAQVITFPLSAFYFHQFPVYFLISNLFIILPTAVIMYAGFAYLLLPQIPVLSKFIASILENTILLMNKGLAVIEHTPYASIGKIWLTIPEYLLLYIIIISLFYFIYGKRTWLLQLSMVSTLFFCTSFSIKKINQSATKSIGWLNLKKHQGIVFKNGNEAIVVSDVKPADKTWQYSIQPYLDSCQVTNVHLVDIKQDVKSAWLVKKYNLIQFFNKKIFIFNGNLRNIPLPQKIQTDYVYLTGNPHGGLIELNNDFYYHILLLDGSNSDQQIRQDTEAVENKPATYKILKRNNSFITLSN